MDETLNSKIVNRLNSIDVFRGFAIALMLICDNPGNPARVYPQLRHAQWNGWTVADLGFPFFMIIMAMVIPITIDKRLKRGDKWFNVLVHIVLRSIKLFLAGLFLNGFPMFNLDIIRIPGVLQRLAIVYLVTGLVYLTITKLMGNFQMRKLILEISIAFAIILIYAIIFKFSPVPKQSNLVQKIDLYFLKGHLYTPEWDPEGILSTFPSIASGFFGLAAGQILTNTYKKREMPFVILFLSGVVLTLLTLTINRWIPINKNIWSSTFVLLTSGLAYIIVALLYYIIDIKNHVKMFKPFVLIGGSPFVIYIISEIIRKTLWVIPVTSQSQGTVMTMNVWLTTIFFTPWAGNWLDSLYFSLFYAIVWSYLVYLNKKAKA